ncbi:hypothetical protein JJB07_18770 [Tumebacillus sp. ITR2]|uniref:DNA mismatch repair protein n=1 Tax=Tumebacillus amylolyticus TaxID=2801339 RepID=A0ABS1JEI7_9BACL|nr:hypothetical protein [Tumebacillus amylolyticus]MBL0388653.1 hypothetical protein [Tumebacillus amylolyticus]
MKTTRQEVMDWGLHFMNEIGTDEICSVCISYGGSCCSGCKHLADGVGCQSRNTSCTSWLCGYLLFIFHETGLLYDWNEFWEQVPGKAYRQDSTPHELDIENWLGTRDLRRLTALFSKDLEELVQTDRQYYVVRLNDLLYRYISAAYAISPLDQNSVNSLNRKLHRLTKGFQRYHTFKKHHIR